MSPSLRDSVDDLAGVPQGSAWGWLVTVALVVATLVGLCGETRHRPSTPRAGEQRGEGAITSPERP